jgi:Holliday junction DNA helicase RuvA
MIAQLHGTLLDKRPNQIVIDVHGVGYLVHIPFSTYGALGDLHAETTLLIHTHLREDGISLYGFLSAREKHCFELLISASGVGPSLAMKILSGMNVEDLIPAIRSGDLASLTRIPGVGKKTAERIVVELRDKLAAMETPETPSRAAASPSGPAEEVVSALINLGYDRREAESAVEEIRGAQKSAGFDALLKSALQKLSGSAPARRSSAASQPGAQPDRNSPERKLRAAR